MHIPKYWARAGVTKNGRNYNTASGWSDVSPEDACDNARARADRVMLALASRRDLKRYEYGERDPLREEVLERHGEEGAPDQIVVTLNRYGALVLNSARVMFVDIDDPKPKPTIRDFLSAIVGRKPVDGKPADMEQRLRQIAQMVRGQGNPRCAVYRTRAGYRVLVMGRLFDPTSDETRAFLDACGSDPLYTHLTRNQKCFRARPSPKPWRCKLSRPPFDFPRDSDKEQEAFLKWEEKYTSVSGQFAVCEFMGEIGEGPETSEGLFVRKLHDSFCLSPGKPLA